MSLQKEGNPGASSPGSQFYTSPRARGGHPVEAVTSPAALR